MTARLESVTLTDFRSVRGTITIPLDAPVVLIHGMNGSGKTSILSAIELALTGDIPELRRADPDFVRYLVHRGATRARIEISQIGEDGEHAFGEAEVTQNRLEKGAC